jgi:predicted dehydrogenase
VEKPIAGDYAAAELLLAASNTLDRVLMIGHLERFNPAITTLRALLPREELFAFALERLSPTPPRDRSADIIFDLMIHDLDLALALSGSTVESINAMGHQVRYGFIDHVTALLRFASGATATLTASAVSQQRVRRGRFFTRNAEYAVDLTRRELWVQRYGPSTITNEKGQCYQTTAVEQIPVPNEDALTVEHEHFLHAIRTNTAPLTTAESGLQVLQLAQTIQQIVNEQLGI